jgi:hypothetical protein
MAHRLMTDSPPERARTSPGRIIAGIVASLAGLVLAAFCLAVANFMTFGLYSWQEPSVDPAVWIPLLGIAVTLPLGPVVLSVNGDRRRWLIVAGVTSLLGVLLASLITWIPLAAGFHW